MDERAALSNDCSRCSELDALLAVPLVLNKLLVLVPNQDVKKFCDDELDPRVSIDCCCIFGLESVSDSFPVPLPLGEGLDIMISETSDSGRDLRSFSGLSDVCFVSDAAAFPTN